MTTDELKHAVILAIRLSEARSEDKEVKELTSWVIRLAGLALHQMTVIKNGEEAFGVMIDIARDIAKDKI